MTLITFRNYCFQIIIKNLAKCNILKTFALKNNGKLVNHNLEKLCSWSLALASTIPVLGLKRICPRKVGPWPRIFFESLNLASKVVSSTPSLLAVFSFFFGRQFLRQRSNHQSDCSHAFFYVCSYASDSVWRKAVRDGFSFTFFVRCLPFAAYCCWCLLLLKVE